MSRRLERGLAVCGATVVRLGTWALAAERTGFGRAGEAEAGLLNRWLDTGGCGGALWRAVMSARPVVAPTRSANWTTDVRGLPQGRRHVFGRLGSGDGREQGVGFAELAGGPLSRAWSMSAWSSALTWLSTVTYEPNSARPSASTTNARLAHTARGKGPVSRALGVFDLLFGSPRGPPHDPDEHDRDPDRRQRQQDEARQLDGLVERADGDDGRGHTADPDDQAAAETQRGRSTTA